MTRSPLIPIFLTVFVDILGFTMILPLLPFYTEKFGGSPAVYGLLVTSYAFCQLLSGPLLGQISDKVGRKPLLLLSQGGSFVGFIIMAYSHTLWMLFIARIIDGITAGNISLAQAYISDVTAPKDRAKSFAVIGISFGVGFLIGPAISGFLSQYGYTYPALAAGFLSLLSMATTAVFLPAHPKKFEDPSGVTVPPLQKVSVFHPRKYAHFFKNPELRKLLFQFFCFTFGFSMFIGGFALFTERRLGGGSHPFGAREVGYLYAYAGFLGIIVQGGLLGRLVKKFGERKVIGGGFLAMFLGYTLLGYAYSLPGFLIVMVFGSFGTGLLRPAITSLVTQKAARHEQGLVLGLTQSLNSIAAIITPSLAGYLIGQGWLAGWAWAAGAAGIAGLFFQFQKSPTRVEVNG